jgi:hypothetical protein
MLAISPRMSMGVSAATTATMIPIRSWLLWGAPSEGCTSENILGSRPSLAIWKKMRLRSDFDQHREPGQPDDINALGDRIGHAEFGVGHEACEYTGDRDIEDGAD